MRSTRPFLFFVPGAVLSLVLLAGPALAAKSRTEQMTDPLVAPPEAAAGCSSAGMPSTAAPALVLALGLPWLIRRRKRSA